MSVELAMFVGLILGLGIWGCWELVRQALRSIPPAYLEPEWREEPPVIYAVDPVDSPLAEAARMSPRYPHQLIDANMPLNPEMQKKISRELRERVDDIQRKTQLPE